MSKRYPKGTDIGEITQFDRGTKVAFECKEHPGAVWVSKEPHVSHWFPGNELAREYADRIKTDPCPHTHRDDVWITATEYTGLA